MQGRTIKQILRSVDTGITYGDGELMTRVRYRNRTVGFIIPAGEPGEGYVYRSKPRTPALAIESAAFDSVQEVKDYLEAIYVD